MSTVFDIFNDLHNMVFQDTGVPIVPKGLIRADRMNGGATATAHETLNRKYACALKTFKPMITSTSSYMHTYYYKKT